MVITWGNTREKPKAQSHHSYTQYCNKSQLHKVEHMPAVFRCVISKYKNRDLYDGNSLMCNVNNRR